METQRDRNPSINPDDKKSEELRIREEEEERAGIPNVDIYINMDKDTWYSFKPNSNSNSSIKHEALPPLPEPIEDATYVDLCSFIFASGGLFLDKPPGYMPPDAIVYVPPSTNKVFYINTLNPEEGWKAAPPMKENRYEHIMLADAGKIYVLGGLNLHRHRHRHPTYSTDGKYIFAEVFDPLNPDAGWKSLACVNKNELDLPQHIDGYAVLGNSHMDRKILFYSYYRESLYYLSTERQDNVGIYDANFGQFRTSSVSLGGTFFFLHYSNSSLHAYDILASSSKTKRVHLIGLMHDTLPHTEYSDESQPLKVLQSLGNGYLALISMKSPQFVSCYHIHCSVIKMSKFRDSFIGKVVNHSSYAVKSGGWLRSCVAVWTPGEDVSLDEERGKRSDEQQQQHKRKWDDEVGSSLST